MISFVNTVWQYGIAYTHKLVMLSLLPLTHLVFPCFNFSYQIVRHAILIPLAICFNIMIYGFVYLPSKPILYMLAIEEPTKEVLMAMVPHFQFFVMVLVHYLMVGIIFGLITGVVTGFNLRIIKFLLTSQATDAAPKKGTDIKKQEIPLLNELASQSSSGVSTGYNTKKTLPDDFDSVSEQLDPRRLGSSLKYISSEDMPTRSELSVGGSKQGYEDDDGYSYTTGDGTNVRTIPFPNESQVRLRTNPLKNDEYSKFIDSETNKKQDVKLNVEDTNKGKTKADAKGNYDGEPINTNEGDTKNDTDVEHNTTDTTRNDLFSISTRDLDLDTLASHVSIPEINNKKKK